MKESVSETASERVGDALVGQVLGCHCSDLNKLSFAKKYVYTSFFKYKTSGSTENTLIAVFLSSSFTVKREIVLKSDEIKSLRKDPAVLSHVASECRAKYVVMCLYTAGFPNMESEYGFADSIYRALGKVKLYDFVVIGDGVLRCLMDSFR